MQNYFWEYLKINMIIIGLGTENPERGLNILHPQESIRYE